MMASVDLKHKVRLLAPLINSTRTGELCVQIITFSEVANYGQGCTITVHKTMRPSIYLILTKFNQPFVNEK